MISSICWSHWLFLFVMNTTHLSELGYPKFCTVVLDLALLLLLKTLGSCITLKIVWIVHFHFINWDTQGRNKSLWWARYCFLGLKPFNHGLGIFLGKQVNFVTFICSRNWYWPIMPVPRVWSDFLSKNKEISFLWTEFEPALSHIKA